jgi:glycerol-3-phosphate O-acyltransferase
MFNEMAVLEESTATRTQRYSLDSRLTGAARGALASLLTTYYRNSALHSFTKPTL